MHISVIRALLTVDATWSSVFATLSSPCMPLLFPSPTELVLGTNSAANARVAVSTAACISHLHSGSTSIRPLFAKALWKISLCWTQSQIKTIAATTCFLLDMLDESKTILPTCKETYLTRDCLRACPGGLENRRRKPLFQRMTYKTFRYGNCCTHRLNEFE